MSNESKLSATARYVIGLCEKIIQDIKSGECSEDEMNDIILKTEPRHNGYINPKEYLTADKACKYLGVHRVQFYDLLKRHRITCNRVNNMPIGYYMRDLDKIKHAMQKDKNKATR